MADAMLSPARRTNAGRDACKTDTGATYRSIRCRGGSPR
jgi:hypothetical protein